MKNQICIILILMIGSICFANSAPVVTQVTASQRTDGSRLVDIRYNLYDADNDKCTVTVQVSSDSGVTWTVPAVTFLPGSAVGNNISRGNGKLIVWDAGKDLPGVYGSDYQVKVTAADIRIFDGLVAYWSFDDATAADNSGNGNGGTIHGATPVSSKPGMGMALSFDGSYDYISTSSVIPVSGNSNRTLSAWIKLNNVSNDQYIVTLGDTLRARKAFAINVYQNKPRIVTIHDDYNSNYVLSTGKWYHLVATYKDGIAKLYINGNYDGQYAVDIDTELRTAVIGSNSHLGTWTNGIIDEVQIYRRALNTSEIQNLYLNP